MGLFLSSNQKLFGMYYNRYQSLYDEYKELYDDTMPENYRLFDIRYRITLSVTPVFETSFNTTMTESIKTTYKLLMKINDAWFAYQALFKLCDQEDVITSSSFITNPIDEATIQSLDLHDTANIMHRYIMKNLLMDPKKKTDLLNFVEYLKEDTDQLIFSSLSSARLLLDQNKTLGLKEVLAIIYALRDNYMYHGATARSGVDFYSTKIYFLKPIYDFFVLFNLKLIMNILEKKIANIEPDEV